MLCAYGRSANVQPAGFPVLKETDKAGTATAALCATSTAGHKVEAATEGAVAEGSLSLPSSAPADSRPANAALMRATDDALTAAAPVGAEPSSTDGEMPAGKRQVAEGRLQVV